MNRLYLWNQVIRRPLILWHFFVWRGQNSYIGFSAFPLGFGKIEFPALESLRSPFPPFQAPASVQDGHSSKLHWKEAMCRYTPT